ncbi:MAG: trimethylamine methyltransferase family protein, partial [Alphaproteobacteria bacterium]
QAAERAVRPGLEGGRYRPLTDREMEQVHRAALEVLERIGLAEAIESCQELVVGAGGRVNDTGRLCFPRALVEDILARAGRNFVLHAQDPERDLDLSGRRVHFGTAGAAVNVLDLETGAYRDSTLADLYDLARLVDTLDNIHWFLRPLVCRDMATNEELDINTAYACMSGTTKHIGTSIIDPRYVEPVVAMFDTVLGGEGRFRRQPFCHLSSCFVVPPLRFAQDACRTLEAAVRLGMPVLLLSAGQAGATSPAALAGALVQAVAEVLAGLVYVNLLAPGHPAIFGAWPLVSDLRTGAFSGGSGEEALLMAASAQMANFYDLPGGVAAGMSDSKLPDAQAGYEKGYTTALAGLAGANLIYESAGMLASLLATSFEGFVIDNDLLGAVLRTVRGIEVTDEKLSVDVIEEVVDGEGHYLGHDQTLSLMERDYVYPQVGDRRNPDDWREDGAADVRERARQEVRATLARHYPTHIDPAIDRSIRERFPIRLPRDHMRPGNARWAAA